jgi:hypothetical protein
MICLKQVLSVIRREQFIIHIKHKQNIFSPTNPQVYAFIKTVLLKTTRGNNLIKLQVPLS